MIPTFPEPQGPFPEVCEHHGAYDDQGDGCVQCEAEFQEGLREHAWMAGPTAKAMREWERMPEEERRGVRA